VRKGLFVGIDYYTHFKSLNGCVSDAHAMENVLKFHANGKANFPEPRVLTATSPANLVQRDELKEAVREVFSSETNIALFYFAGHGHIEDTGGFLCTSDCNRGDDGLALSDLMILAFKSKAKNKVIILDSCHSGAAGDRSIAEGISEIGQGMTILAASTDKQYAIEHSCGGVFTGLLVDALNGAAANLVGDVTPGSAYAHIDQSLGPWAQRPVFKTNVKQFTSLRTVTPPIPFEHLKALATHFPEPSFDFGLDPSYEPERSEDQKKDPNIPPPDPEKTAVFAVLQNYVKVNLVRPVGAPHMWHAAMQSKSCQLTVLGEHYRELVAKGLI
jgi:hypothetical protein